MTSNDELRSRMGRLSETHQLGELTIDGVHDRNGRRVRRQRFVGMGAVLLLVLATAISQPAEGRITIDAGYKSFAADQETPQLRDIDGVSYRWGGDEHGILLFNNPSQRIEVGDKVLLIASHCDPTVNLYDHYYPYRDEMVSELWPIAGRGRSQ